MLNSIENLQFNSFYIQGKESDEIKCICLDQNLNVSEVSQPNHFNSRLRDELLTKYAFDLMWYLGFVHLKHRRIDNHYRLDSALAYPTAIEYATK